MKIIDSTEKRIISIWNWFTECIFYKADHSFSKAQVWLQRLWIGGVYLMGLATWTVFLGFGKFNWGVEDWIWEWRYSRILQEAVTTGQLPLHTTEGVAYHATRFLGIPDVNLGPQLILLRFFDIGTSFLIGMLLMYSLGFIGCLRIKRYYNLSVFSFTICALLINLNGFITSNFGIGHTLYTGYFLFPFFILLTLQLIDGKSPANWFARMGLVLFGMELVGTTQLYAACIMFLGVLLLFASNHRAQLFKAILAGIALNIYRIVPAFIALGSFSKPPFAGFSTLGDLIAGLIWIIRPPESFVHLPILWIEFDMYASVLGFIFLVVFGLYLTWKPQKDGQINEHHRSLGLTMLTFTTFSIGYLYRPINSLPIPLLNLIHVPSRFIIVPFLTTIVLASARLQKWLDERECRPWLSFFLLMSLAVLGNDLYNHARIWRVELVFEAFPEKALDYGLRIANRIDPVYTNTLAICYALSLIALGYIVFVLIRRRKTYPEQGGI